MSEVKVTADGKQIKEDKERRNETMLRFELIDNTNDHVIYRYFPDNKDESGLISVRKSDGEIIEQIVNENDDFKWCFFKMYKRIKQFI